MIPVLFIDDNRELCTLFQIYLEESGEFSVHICNNGEEGLTYLQNNQVMAVISDYDMPEMNGIDLLKQIRMRYPHLPFIMLTGNDSKDTAIAALNAGADFYQNKADDFEVQVFDLAHKIRVLTSRHEAEESARRKDGILAAISYAAERLLRGNSWQEDMHEVLGHLGRATSASSVFVAGAGDDPARGAVIDQVTWERFSPPSSADHYSLIHTWWQVPHRIELLATNHEVQGSEVCDRGTNYLRMAEVGTILLIPIFLEDEWWGVLGITDVHSNRIFSDEEVSALRMASRVIGSARYRMYIEEIFRNPVENSLVGVFLILGGRFLYVNPKFCEIFGHSRKKISSIVNPLEVIHPQSHDEVTRIIHAVQKKEIPDKHFEAAGIRSDGHRICLEIYLTTIIFDNREYLIGNIMDISDQHRARRALAESERRFRDLFTNIRDLVILHRIPEEGGRIIEVNQAVCDTLAYDRIRLLSLTFPALCPADNELGAILSHCREATDTGRSKIQTFLVKRDGYPIPADIITHRVEMGGSPVLFSVARDITEQTEAEAKIRAGEELLKRNMLTSLREKETLLREIHHRVKNNMQIIISLLKLQDFKIDDPHVHEIIRDCRSRIYSMAVIHEKLYQTDDLTSIRLDEYFSDLGDRVMNEFQNDELLIKLILESDHEVLVDINTGIPLGLIMNELITNSMKYAFNPGEKGEVRIDIHQRADSLLITVADTGRGLPEEFDASKSTTLGTELVRGLVFQLGGSVSWYTDNGAVCMVKIPMPHCEGLEQP